EWPNDTNNVRYEPIFIEPLPLPDLVVEDVIAPAEKPEGSEIPVRYTVTNRGSGATDTANWTDTIWLTRDKNRPLPAAGDYLLKTIPHSGTLGVLHGYDVDTTVTLPTGIDSGVWYIMPWTDPYDTVLEDNLASNPNDDDPNGIESNNYK